MSEIKTGWLIDFNDQIFAPKTVFSQVFQDSDGKDLNYYFNSIEAFHNDKFDNGILKVSKGGTGASDAASARDKLGVAPISHATSGDTYGLGTLGLYGHVKLTNTINDSDTNGVAVTPKAVNVHVAASFNNLNGRIDGLLTPDKAIGTQTEPIYWNGTSLVKCSGVIVTSGDQEFTGIKTFSSGINMKGSNITNIGGWSSNSDEFYFIDNAENTIVFIDNEGVHTTNLSFGNKSNNKGIVMTYDSDDTLTITFEN